MSAKREPVAGVTGSERPVDMSLPARGLQQPRAPLLVAVRLDPVAYQNDKAFGSYFNDQCHGQASQSSPLSANKKLDQNIFLETLSPNTPPPDMKYSDGNGTMSETLTKKNRTLTMSPVELFPASIHQRAKREFVPEFKKDDIYWSKRLKNNESARRSRVKRKALEKMMEVRLAELQKENIELKHEVAALRRRYCEQDGSSSSFLGSQEQTSRNSPTLPPSPPEENTGKAEDDYQSSESGDARSDDDSWVYTMGSESALNRSLAPDSRNRMGSIGSRFTSLPCGRQGSKNTQESYVDLSLRCDLIGALDLTGGQNSCSTGTWKSSSPESLITNPDSFKPNIPLSSDSGSLEGASTGSMKVFPPKCRWKKELYSSHIPPAEEHQ